MRWFVMVTVAVFLVAACSSTDPGQTDEAAREAAATYADESLGLATGGVWRDTGAAVTDVHVSSDGACAVALVEFEPDTVSFVVPLASLDHFTLEEVFEAQPSQVWTLEDLERVVADRSWTPTLDHPYGGPDATLEPYRDGTVTFDETCQTIARP